MPQLNTINGSWSSDDNAWVSDTLCLTCDIWLEVVLPDKGRMVIKKSETEDGPWPKALITGWTGPAFRVAVYSSTEYRYVRIYLTETPTRIEYVNRKDCDEADQ